MKNTIYYSGRRFSLRSLAVTEFIRWFAILQQSQSRIEFRSTTKVNKENNLGEHDFVLTNQDGNLLYSNKELKGKFGSSTFSLAHVRRTAIAQISL